MAPGGVNYPYGGLKIEILLRKSTICVPRGIEVKKEIDGKFEGPIT